MPKADRPLAAAERDEVEGRVAGALKWLGADAGSESPDQLQQRLDVALHALRLGWASGDITQITLCLAYLWGQTVCDRLGWEWAAVSLKPDAEELGVVNPSRSHVILPLEYVEELISDPARNQSILLLYDRLKAGSLPPADPGEYSVIG
jgi:hypothetical protein